MLLRLLLRFALLSAALLRAAATLGAGASVVLDWHDAAVAVLRGVPVGPPRANAYSRQPIKAQPALRVLARLHVALHETVLLFGGNTSALAAAASAADVAAATAPAAAAAAAHRVLAHSFPPCWQPSFDALLAAHLAAFAPQPAAAAAALRVGRAAAGLLLDATANDGSQAFANISLSFNAAGSLATNTSAAPGRFAPTYMIPGMLFEYADLPQYATAATLVVADDDAAWQLPGPPPLWSAAYNTSFAFVIANGNMSSAVRTADQAELMYFWRTAGFTSTDGGIWVAAAAAMLAASGTTYDLVAVSRLTALMCSAMWDTALLTWREKYRWLAWRPETAARAAGLAWQPVMAVGSPEYPSGHTTQCAAAAGVMQPFFGGDAISPPLLLLSEDTSQGGNGGGVSGYPAPLPARRYASLAAMVADCAQSRMASGLHFPFSGTDGVLLGNAVAARVFATYPGKLAKLTRSVTAATASAAAPPPPPPNALYDMPYDLHLYEMPGLSFGSDVISRLTGGACAFLEGPFDETFAAGGGVGPQWANASALNGTRWATGADAAALLGCDAMADDAASGQACTVAMGVDAALQLNASLPGYAYADGSRGAVITLSQAPCVGGGCGGAAWSSAQLRSRGCWQFGTMEVVAAMDFSAAAAQGLAPAFVAQSLLPGGGFAVRGVPFLDTTWSEIDSVVSYDPAAADYVLTTLARTGAAAGAVPPPATRAAFDVAGSRATAAQAGLQAHAASPWTGAAAPFCTGLNGSCIIYGEYVGAVPARYSAAFATAYHAYKIVWDPQFLLYMVDMHIYRNISTPIWRPMQLRFGLFPGVGAPATAVAGNLAPDARVFIRRVRHFPVHNLSKIEYAVVGPWPPMDLDGWGIRVAPPTPGANSPPQPPAPPPFPPYPPWPPSPSPPSPQPPPRPPPPQPPAASQAVRAPRGLVLALPLLLLLRPRI